MQSLTAKDGKLTRYALACGYEERRDADFDDPTFRMVRLYMDGSTILVSVYQRATGTREQFNARTMRQAYAMFNRQCKRLGLGRWTSQVSTKISTQNAS